LLHRLPVPFSFSSPFSFYLICMNWIRHCHHNLHYEGLLIKERKKRKWRIYSLWISVILYKLVFSCHISSHLSVIIRLWLLLKKTCADNSESKVRKGKDIKCGLYHFKEVRLCKVMWVLIIHDAIYFIFESMHNKAMLKLPIFINVQYIWTLLVAYWLTCI